MAGLLTFPAEEALPEAGEALLRETLRRWSSQAFDRELANCGISVLEYVEAATGREAPADLGAPDATTRALLWGDEAAFRVHAAAIFAALALAPAEAPTRGDIGLVRVPAAGLTAAICLAARAAGERSLWVVRGAREAVIAPLRHTDAWRVPCRRR